MTTQASAMIMSALGPRVPLGRIAGGRAACQCSRLLSGGLRRLNGMERHAMEAWALPYLRASNMRQEPHKSLCRWDHTGGAKWMRSKSYTRHRSGHSFPS